MAKIFRVEIETGISGFTADLNKSELYIHPDYSEDRVNTLLRKEGHTPKMVVATRYYKLVFNPDLVEDLIEEIENECTHINSSYPDSDGDIHCLDCQLVLGNIHPENF